MDPTLHVTAGTIASFLGGIAVGSIGTLIGVRISTRKTVSGAGSMVDQSNARAGNDIVGRNKNTKS